MSVEHLKAPPERLTCRCDPDSLGFETTADVEPLDSAIGQERAISALEMGLDIDAGGFNVFVSGVPGTGRNTTLRAHLERTAATKPNPPDWGYVYNFTDPAQPAPLCLPCGLMRMLAQDMEQLVETCREEIPAVFDSDDYRHRVQDILNDVQAQRQSVTDGYEKQARERGFTLSLTQTGVQVQITPVALHPEGRPLTQEEFAQLPEPVQAQLRERAAEVQHDIDHALAEFRRLNQQVHDRQRGVDVELVRYTLQPIIDGLQEKYEEHRDVVSYLDEVEADMVSHAEAFKPRGDEPIPGGVPTRDTGEDNFFLRYQVNDLVDNALCNGAPVEFENNPAYYNLFGRIDYRARMGALTTDHTMIKAGALHRASGGYLVVQAKDLLASPMSWDTLKRVLRSGELRVENIGEQNTAVPTTTMRPQPIPVRAKVVLVGNPGVLYALQAADEDFRRFFKVTAEFDTVMDRTPENIAKYATFVASRVAEKGLRPFDKTAVAAVVDYSSRIVENQEKLTTRFLHVADVLAEADYWAGKSDRATVTAEHLTKAVRQSQYRASLTEDRLLEAIENGTVRIATGGRAVGQVNGLAVYSLGEHSFGKPSRISAKVSLGRGQVVNIDRETRMSGRLHDKGFLILNGYLQGKYGRNKPLSMSASITFEQSYSEIDGDSASSAELYALLSELSGVGIKQGIAVTGSVNQAGEVQAIGGATYKIEGFFDVCQAKGLTGEQGVMVPESNVRNLTLNREVVDAVRAGQFHIYAVSTIDEGIEVLTGTAAGEADADGQYPEGTIHCLVERRLEEMAERALRFTPSGWPIRAAE